MRHTIRHINLMQCLRLSVAHKDEGNNKKREEKRLNKACAEMTQNRGSLHVLNHVPRFYEKKTLMFYHLDLRTDDGGHLN